MKRENGKEKTMMKKCKINVKKREENLMFPIFDEF